MNNEEMRKMWEEAANQNKQERKPGLGDDNVRADIRNTPHYLAFRERIINKKRDELKNKERDDSYNKYLDDHAKKYPEQADVVDNYRPNKNI